MFYIVSLLHKEIMEVKDLAEKLWKMTTYSLWNKKASVKIKLWNKKTSKLWKSKPSPMLYFQSYDGIPGFERAHLSSKGKYCEYCLYVLGMLKP